MKRCPQCSGQYGDDVSFCKKDGRALAAIVSSRSRLCPHCANSVQENAVKCPYCKAELSSTGEPQWPMREELSGEAPPGRHRDPPSTRSKAILAAGFVVFALGVYFTGGHQQRSETRQLEEANEKELQQRELKIQALEEQLKQVREQLAQTNKQMAGLTGKLQQKQKELSAVQQELASAKREAARLVARLATVDTRPTARVTDRSPPPAPPVRRSMEPGVYEVIRATAVHEEPSASARRIAEINKGTKIAVVRSVGDWLEVRSRQGNPPGFIRLDDATFVGRTN